MRNIVKLPVIVGWIFAMCVVVLSNADKNATCDSLFPIEDSKTDLNGYMNYQGKIIVKPQFVSALDFAEKVGVVWVTYDDTGYVDLNGKLTVFPGVQIVGGVFSEGVTIAERDRRYGYFIDKTGRTIFKIPEFDGNYIAAFSEGLVSVMVKDKFYFFNKKGEMAFNKGFDYVMNGFVDGMATVMDSVGWAVINKKGEYIISPMEEPISEPSDGLVYWDGPDSYTYYTNNKGEVVLKTQYSSRDFSEGFALFLGKNREKWGYMNKKGKVVIRPQFDSAENFSEGLAEVKIRNRSGFINKHGQIVIKPKFELVQNPFKCGIAYVKDKFWEGYINTKGNWVWKKAIRRRSDYRKPLH